MKKSSDINTILVIGNGLMGNQIACQCALFGKNVRMFIGLAEETIGTVQAIQKKYLDSLIEKEMISQKIADEAMARITYSEDIEEICKDVELVTESVIEAIPIKQEIWARFAPYLPKDAILTSNTSTLAVSEYAEATGAPERFMAWHGHAPVFIQNYFDIMPHEGPDISIIQPMIEFSESIGLTCGVLTKETPGYLANNMLTAVFDAAFELYLDGAASYQDIDKAWMAVRVYPIGPFGLMDKIGLRTVRHVNAARERTPLIERVLELVDRMIAEGRLGCEVQKGFYEYPDAEFLRDDFVKRAKPLL